MKGALMKLGQMASYLDEGLPEPVRMALAHLRTDAPLMSAQLAAGASLVRRSDRRRRVGPLHPVQARRRITAQVYLQRKPDAWSSWATEHVAEHDWRAILEAGKAIGAFASSDWIVARSRS